MDWYQRYLNHQNKVQNATAAGLLVVAEEIHELVRLLRSVDLAVDRIEGRTPPEPPPSSADGIDYIRKEYVGP